eukprot:Nk52_evm15s299 gene=Nk52_evmTU15s299
MHLYNLQLQKPGGLNMAVVGNFSGAKQQEIVGCSGGTLTMFVPNAKTGKIAPTVRTEVFGVIRSLQAFRLTGGSKDSLVVGSDSGKITILEYNVKERRFDRVHIETFGKSGCRRIVPGEYLAVEPKGRAVMIAAVEKQKLVYILNRDNAARLTISSPLEAHKSKTIILNVVGVDVGFENPVFACIELDYEDLEEDDGEEDGGNMSNAAKLATKSLASVSFYELDLGLNHVVRKKMAPLEAGQFANMLIPVPGGSDGPSGVIVCVENAIIYKPYVTEQDDVVCPLPVRSNCADRCMKEGATSTTGTIVVAYAMHRTKRMLFFLLQTEVGDVFKVTLDVDDDLVTALRIKYFDTLPIASSLCVLKSGFLFVASEFGNHYFYQISGLGDDNELEFSSSDVSAKNGNPFYFEAGKLTNLLLVDEIDSLCPIIDCKPVDMTGEGDVQIYAACGRGPKSTLRTLRHGLEVSEFMSAPGLPGNPNALWTIKSSVNDKFHSFIVVSFLDATLVLTIGESVEEASGTGFLSDCSTLHCGHMDPDSLLQITLGSIRHIKSEKRVNEWKLPGTERILKGANNEKQVAVALNTNELVYFELDEGGHLNEYTDRFNLSAAATCLCIGDIPEGRLRSRFLAVGVGDNTVRIISLEANDCLESLSMQAVPAKPTSVCIVRMKNSDASTESTDTFLYVGLENGVVMRSLLEVSTGVCSDTRTRYLGTKPVKLFKVAVQGGNAVLALSSKSWLSYNFQANTYFTPLSYDELSFASNLSFEQATESIVAVTGNTLRIIAIEKLGTIFNSVSAELKYTPKRICAHSSSSSIVVVESDHNCISEQKVLSDGDPVLPSKEFGSVRGGNGTWASCVRLLSAKTSSALNIHEFSQNEGAFCVCSCSLMNGDDAEFVVVGTAKDVTLNPRSCSAGFLYVFKVVATESGTEEQGYEFQLVHRTVCDGIPTAIHPYQGRLLVGVDKVLRIYELGKKSLLRKSELKNLPNNIVSICSMGSRIVVADVQESVHFITYRNTDNQMVIFADDLTPRWMTCVVPLDYNTVAGGDKFGNIFVVRLSSETQEDIADDPSGTRVSWERGVLNGASQKTEVVANMYVGETVTSLHRCSLVAGAGECLVYTTICGTIGIFAPFTSKEDVDFFQHLEMSLRNENEPICGRDHLAYRSYYTPVKNVVDGDFCEQFNGLSFKKRKQIAEELDRTPNEVSRKLEDMRGFYAF